jgi:hypothetical protein
VGSEFSATLLCGEALLGLLGIVSGIKSITHTLTHPRGCLCVHLLLTDLPTSILPLDPYVRIAAAGVATVWVLMALPGKTTQSITTFDIPREVNMAYDRDGAELSLEHPYIIFLRSRHSPNTLFAPAKSHLV